MWNLRILGALLFVTAPVGLAGAQLSRPIDFELEHAVFAFDDERSLLDIYLAFDVHSILEATDSLSLRARIPVKLSLWSVIYAERPEDEGLYVWRDSLELSVDRPTLSRSTPGGYIFQRVEAEVPAGAYRLQVELPQNAQFGYAALRHQWEVIVPDFSDPARAYMSDLLIADAVAQTEDAQRPLFKRGYVVYPNVGQVFRDDRRTLHYYVEAYHIGRWSRIDRPDDRLTRYTAYAYLTHANRLLPLAGYEHESERPARSTDVLVGEFDLSDLPVGEYFLRVVLLDDRDEPIIEQFRAFTIVEPEPAPAPAVETRTFADSLYAGKPPREIEEELEQVRLIASDEELAVLDTLHDLEAQRAFLVRFWTQRDQDPTTPANTSRERFVRRVTTATATYQDEPEVGWKTPRGRVLVRYGRPDVIEPHLDPPEPEKQPYEIWQYRHIDGVGTAIFVFVDLAGVGELQLIHSNVPGEPKRADWQDLLEPFGRDTDQ